MNVNSGVFNPSADFKMNHDWANASVFDQYNPGIGGGQPVDTAAGGDPYYGDRQERTNYQPRGDDGFEDGQGYRGDSRQQTQTQWRAKGDRGAQEQRGRVVIDEEGKGASYEHTGSYYQGGGYYNERTRYHYDEVTRQQWEHNYHKGTQNQLSNYYDYYGGYYDEYDEDYRGDDGGRDSYYDA